MNQHQLLKLVKQCIAEVITERSDPSLEYPDYKDGDGRPPSNPSDKWSLKNDKDVYHPTPCEKCGGKWSIGHKCSPKIKETSQPEPYDSQSDEFQPSPRERTDASNKSQINSAYENLQNDIDNNIKKDYPGISFGYIGNFSLDSRYGDDRSWYVFSNAMSNKGGKINFGNYSTSELPKMWEDWNNQKERFLNAVKTRTPFIRSNEAGAITVDKVSNSERKKLGMALKTAGADGNKRDFESPGQGLTAVTNALSSVGFGLNMVSGGLNTPKGSLLLPYRRLNDPGQDTFTDKPTIQNSRISFNWENLAGEGQPAKYEILAYAS